VSGALLLALASALPSVQDSPLRSTWSLECELIENRIVDGDTAIQLYQSPVFRSGDRVLRASWLVVWCDRGELRERSRDSSDPASGVESLRRGIEGEGEDTPSLFSRFRDLEATKLAEEIYLEGPIEYLENGQPVGQAGAIYLDMVDGHGWIADAAISVERSIRGRITRLRVLADWLRHSSDGSLRAKDAVVTSCGYDDPHFHISTEDLRINPNPDDPSQLVFDVELRGNEIRLSESIAIPLPKLSYPAGEDFTPKYEGLRLGNSARFGTFAEAELNSDAGKLGERLTSLLGTAPTWPKGRSKVKLRWLGSRGVLVDGSVKFREEERYQWDLNVGGLPDRGEDRGVIRVDQDERDTLRLWYRSRGRFLRGEDEWVDLSFTSQTDPGVQSEFYEKDFLRYEHRDTYLHWRKARNEYYYDATTLFRVDSYRTEVQELPQLGLSRFASELFRVGDQPFLYSTRTTAGYLSRVEGRGFTPPFFAVPVPPEDGVEEPFPDRLGERKVARFDTTHAVEAPFSLGVLGLRAVPFAEVRGTVWDRGVDEDTSPSRVGAFGGLRLATSFWKRRPGGGLHIVSPFAELRQELTTREHDGVPVRFDGVEDPIAGDRYEVGIRSRWLEPDGLDEADIEVKSTYQTSVPGEEDRWLPVEVFTRLYSSVGDVPFGFVQDSRFDLDRDETVYSLTALGLQVSRNWGVELSHLRGRNEAGEALFESASIASRYRWTPKWEFEGSVSIPILDDGEDVQQFTLRRFGHDFLFELEFENRTGEGGSSIGIGFRPLVAWKQSHLGLLER
jgi:hypothetical protein